MKQTINLSGFRDAFQNMDRKENFSYEGLELLFDMSGRHHQPIYR